MGEKAVDLRVNSVPTVHGESIVMRILDKSSLMLGLPELGFLSDDQALFEQLVQLPDGIILVTGPTGSGKTTTLYACLNYMNKPDRKIITVEEPVEYQMAGINQVQVNSEIGMTFPAALRAMLRQAPGTWCFPPSTPTTRPAPSPDWLTSGCNPFSFPAPCGP